MTNPTPTSTEALVAEARKAEAKVATAVAYWLRETREDRDFVDDVQDLCACVSSLADALAQSPLTEPAGRSEQSAGEPGRPEIRQPKEGAAAAVSPSTLTQPTAEQIAGVITEHCGDGEINHFHQAAADEILALLPASAVVEEDAQLDNLRRKPAARSGFRAGYEAKHSPEGGVREALERIASNMMMPGGTTWELECKLRQAIARDALAALEPFPRQEETR